MPFPPCHRSLQRAPKLRDRTRARAVSHLQNRFIRPGGVPPLFEKLPEDFLSSVAGQKVTLSNITVCSENGGRPCTADGMPIVHCDGNVVSILGTTAGGLTLAPLMARMATSYWAGKITPLHLTLSSQLRVLKV
jgi:hypothetical protein